MENKNAPIIIATLAIIGAIILSSVYIVDSMYRIADMYASNTKPENTTSLEE